MASESSPLAQLDTLLSDTLSEWDIYSTAIATIIVAFIGGIWCMSKDPDCHPFLLARQSTEAPIRQEGESGTFRSLETPYGYTLRTGLNVKDPGAPKWTGGRNGDLRDIWRSAVRGTLKPDGAPDGARGKLYTVLGKSFKEHDLDDISQEINILGNYARDAGVKTAVVCLSDSVELLASIFAGAFYDFKVVIVPPTVTAEALARYLQKVQADLLIAQAGALNLPTVKQGNTYLGSVIWVAKHGSRHMDWNEVPEGIGGELKVAVWHEIIQDKKSSIGSDVPPSDPKSQTPPLVSLWSTSDDSGELVEYSPSNLASATAALIATLPRAQRLTHTDLLLSIGSLSRSYPLCLVLAALYTNSSLALNSVSGEGVDFALATAGISPTIIVASSQTMSAYHHKLMEQQTSLVAKLGRWYQSRALDSGLMPTQNLLSKLANVGPTAESSLDKLRLLFISHRADGEQENQLTSEQLADLRIFTGARVVYALTAAKVAGAISQTNAYDYRRSDGPNHFGAPLSSVEITLTGHKEDAGIERAVEGQINVAGPAVVSGKTSLEARGRFNEDYTLSLCA